MPHDKNNNLLQPGDEVIIRCVVKELNASQDFCNCQVETIEAMPPENYKQVMWFNTRQVEKSPQTTYGVIAGGVDHTLIKGMQGE